jgi:hypothetical protein
VSQSGIVQLTPKGEEELERRAYKVGVKKRSLLILLKSPQSIDYLLQKTILPQGEFDGELQGLIDEGFITTGWSDRASKEQAVAGVPAVRSAFDIDKDILLSEAKFLLADFCVDCFGTESQSFVEEIRACGNVADFRMCFSKALGLTQKKYPKHLSTLMDLLTSINETA